MVDVKLCVLEVVDVLNYNDARSYVLHQLVAERLEEKPAGVLLIAFTNLRSWGRKPGLARSRLYMNEWEETLADLSATLNVLRGLDEHSCVLRSCSPFAGVVSEAERVQLLNEFRKCWSNL